MHDVNKVKYMWQKSTYDISVLLFFPFIFKQYHMKDSACIEFHHRWDIAEGLVLKKYNDQIVNLTEKKLLIIHLYEKNNLYNIVCETGLQTQNT